MVLNALTAGAGIADTILGWLSDNDDSLEQQQFAAATATRTDAYGNKIVYVPGQGWVSQPTDETRKILDAEQNEILASLTEDASRNRSYRGRMDDISRQGTLDLDQALNAKRFAPELSEEAFISDLTRELLSSRKRGLAEGTEVLGKQALRMNQGDLIPKIVAEADRIFGDSLEESVLKGKRLGRQEYQSAKGFQDRGLNNDVNLHAGLARTNPTAPLRFSNHSANIDSSMNAGLNDLMSQLNSQSNDSPFPFGAVVDDVSGLIQALGSGFKSSVEPSRKQTYLPLK